MNVARLTLLLALTPLAAPLAAQGIDKEDPCYQILTAAPLWIWTDSPWPKDGQTLRSLLPRIPTVWNNREELQDYVTNLAGVVGRFPNVAMTPLVMNSYFDQASWDMVALTSVSNCLPWLEDLVNKLESRLGELGSSGSASIVAARPAAKDPRFDQMRKQLRDLAQALEQMRTRPPGRRP